jgi:hypothetical protein
MSVSTQHPEYSAAAKRWKLIRDIIDNCAKHRIRTPDVNDPIRSEQYKEDAILTNFTKLTQNGLTGLVFRNPPVIELPAELDYLYDDVTGSGVNIWQFSQHTVGETLCFGRYGLLSDYNAESGKAFIKPYAPEAVINWKTRLVNGVIQPWLITLVEYIVREDPDDEFCQDVVIQYRVLKLDNTNTYYQEIQNEDEEIIEIIQIFDKDGGTFDYIPFSFVGSSNNDWVVDYQPLYDLAVINQGHYRCSADLLESSWICGQPTYHLDVGETSEEEFKENNAGVNLGSRKMVITKGGRLDIIQANANQLVSQIMKDLMEQAVGLGAKIIEGAQGTRETAEGAKIRHASAHSALYTLTNNVAWAVEKAIKTCCRFMGSKEETVVYTLNSEFFDETADPNLIAQQIMLLDRGVIAKEEILSYGRKTGWIDENRSNDDIEAEAEIADPLQGVVDNEPK